jgi:hypothetical protein
MDEEEEAVTDAGGRSESGCDCDCEFDFEHYGEKESGLSQITTA